MDRKTSDVVQSAGGYEESEQLVNQGRQLHDQAVFELMARLVSRAAYFMEEALRIAINKQDSQNQGYNGVKTLNRVEGQSGA